MNQNVLKWIEALRSGEYEQGYSQLRETKENGKRAFCCLGVACDVYAREHPEAEWEIAGADDLEVFDTHVDTQAAGMRRNWSVLPTPVKEWLGLRMANGEFNDLSSEDEKMTLVTLNDELDRTFEQIADVIEGQPDGLFVEPGKDPTQTENGTEVKS